MKIDIVMPGGAIETDLDVSAENLEELAKALNKGQGGDFVIFQKVNSKPRIINLTNVCVVRQK